MMFKPKAKAPVVFETIAFADIVVNLFVFFFITFGLYATFDQSNKGALPIELPKAANAPKLPKAHEPVVITVQPDGQVIIGVRKIKDGDMKKTLNRELSLNPAKTVLIRADRHIALEKFIGILDEVKTTKAKAVSVETVSS